jgi:hypothetical protein
MINISVDRFLGYLMIFINCIGYIALNARLIANDELENVERSSRGRYSNLGPSENQA